MLEIAKKTWDRVRALRAEQPAGEAAPVERGTGASPLLLQMREENPQFAETFPVPLKWMVEAGQYDAKAFERYLRAGHVRATYKDRQPMEAQSNSIYLFKARNPEPRRLSGRYRDTVAKALKDDDRDFTAARKRPTRTWTSTPRS